MKSIIRHFSIDTYCLYLTSLVASGMIFEQGLKTIIIAGIAVTLVSVFAKPVINLLLLPLNLVTFGIFRWVASAVILYIVTLLVKTFKIIEFSFSGFTNKWIEIPTLHFEGVLAFVAFSFVLSILTSSIHWLVKK
jgi:putative membrane protein